MFPSNLLIGSISFILVKGSILTTIRCSALKQSSYFSFLMFSLLHHLTHACWISSPSNYLTSPICTTPSLKTLQWFIIVFRTKLKLFKGVPQTIIFSYSVSPVVPWPSLYSSNMFFSPLWGL